MEKCGGWGGEGEGEEREPGVEYKSYNPHMFGGDQIKLCGAMVCFWCAAGKVCFY